MLRREDHLRLRHMLDAAREAQGFVADRTRADLSTDRQLTMSVVGCLLIVGEAASQVSPECRAEMPALEWRKIVGMRNRLIHGYFDWNLSIIWKTVREDLPLLVAEVEAALSEATTEDGEGQPAAEG